MPTMKSLYVAILLVMLGILSVSFLAFRSISDRMEKAYFDPVFDEMEQLQIESARAALNQGGPSAVSAYMQRLDQLFGGSHYLLDGHGTDVVSGKNRDEVLPKLPATKSRVRFQDQILITYRSDDGHYWFLVVAPLDKSHPWMLFPYYILVDGHRPPMLACCRGPDFSDPQSIEDRRIIRARGANSKGHDSETG